VALSIRRSPRARRDLVEIWNYIADDNETAADQTLWRIDSVLRMLADNPQSGRHRPELHPEIRSFPMGNYVVFYRALADAIDVVRVLNRYRDITVDEFGE
jgi:toxin ParE1/3/4